MESIYRVALVGCGPRGAWIGQSYADHPRTELVGICDLDPTRLQVVGEKTGVSARFTDLETMLDEVQPQIVSIPTGTEFHYELIQRVLSHGPYHIDVEKPICVDLQQADAVLSRAKELGVRVAVHHQGRVTAESRAAVKAVDSGLIGEPIHALAHGKGYYGGYGIMNIGCHLLTGIQAFLGRCQRVNASLRTNGRPIQPEDVVPSPQGMGTIAGENLSAELEFEGGVNATLIHNRLPSVRRGSNRFQILGTEGRILFQQGEAWHSPTPFALPADGVDRWIKIPREIGRQFDSHAFNTERPDEMDYVEEYVRALDADTDHESSGAVGTHSLEMIMGVFESAAYSRPVDLPQQRRDHPLIRWRSDNGMPALPVAPRPYSDWLAHEDRRLGRA